MKDQNPFCSRKGGCTINNKFYPRAKTSEILGRQLLRQVKKMEKRQAKREAANGWRGR